MLVPGPEISYIACMKRREFARLLPWMSITGLLPRQLAAAPAGATAAGDDRLYWLNLLTKISGPVIEHLSRGELRQKMPLERPAGYSKNVQQVTYLEALGRTLAGISAWLSLPADESAEGRLRAQFAAQARAAIVHTVNPASPDYTDFDAKTESQLLVDGAFLVQGIMRAPQQLWVPLSAAEKQQVITALKKLSWIQPGANNWMLFAAIIETFFLWAGEQWNQQKIDDALTKHKEWYKGDGWYGDGAVFHFDYYNGYVIQPMMLDILAVLKEKNIASAISYELALQRTQRFAAIQERLISPEGTYPPIGRSIVYRIGAFQPLAQMAWKQLLPSQVSPAQVRCAMTAILKKQFEAPGTFSAEGWLQLGFCGHQPEAADTYISTGSLYLCTLGFLPLGLPAEDVFWTAPPQDWSSKKAWSGQTYPEDHAVRF